jgi:hypothetical protein
VVDFDMDSEENRNYQFHTVLNKFLIEINGLATTLPIIMQSIQAEHLSSIEMLAQFLEEKSEAIEQNDTSDGNTKTNTKYKLSTEHFYDLE